MSIGMAGVGPKGLSSATLELLANPKALDKTLASLQSAENEAKKAIELAGPATEILQIRADIEVKLAEAEAVHDKAVEDAEAVEEKAKEKASQIVANAMQKAAEVANDFADEQAEKNKLLDKRESSIAAVESKLDQERAALQKVRDEQQEEHDALATQRTALAGRESEVESLKDSLLQEKTKLTDLREQLTAALR